MDNQRPIVLITGGSGLIGRAVARRLGERFTVVSLDREKPAEPIAGVVHVDVDLTSDSSVSTALSAVGERGRAIASVVHLAAYYDFTGRPNPKYQAITVEGTRRLLRSLREFDVGQFLFSSTMLVHRPCRPGQLIDESWPVEPGWPYPRSKVETENLLLAEHGATPLVMLRIAGVYDDEGHSIPLAHQIHHIYERWLLSHLFPGDLAHGQAFVHLDDLVDAVASCVERRATLPPELTVLIGEPETLSYRELQDRIARLLFGGGWLTVRVPKSTARVGAWARNRLPTREEPLIQPAVIPFADDHYALDIRRARAALDWKPRRSLREALPVIVAKLKADPARWYRVNKIEPPRRWPAQPAETAR